MLVTSYYWFVMSSLLTLKTITMQSPTGIHVDETCRGRRYPQIWPRLLIARNPLLLIPHRQVNYYIVYMELINVYV